MTTTTIVKQTMSTTTSETMTPIIIDDPGLETASVCGGTLGSVVFTVVFIVPVNCAIPVVPKSPVRAVPSVNGVSSADDENGAAVEYRDFGARGPVAVCRCGGAGVAETVIGTGIKEDMLCGVNGFIDDELAGRFPAGVLGTGGEGVLAVDGIRDITGHVCVGVSEAKLDLALK